MLELMVERLIHKSEEDMNTECEQSFYDLFAENDINEFEISIDEMYDSCGMDVYSLSVAWIEDGRLKLKVGCIESR